MTDTEKLLVQIIQLFAERFEGHAILRGGMVLRVLGCERFTNDVDYVFVPFTSKKDVVDEVVATLKSLPNVKISHSLNSKCFRVLVTQGQTVVQVEIKVDQQVPTRVLSTRTLADGISVSPRLIPVLDFPYALADKMAAWNERRLMRDVYDIWFYLRMGVKPDPERLKARLKKPAYSRRVPSSERFSAKSNGNSNCPVTTILRPSGTSASDVSYTTNFTWGNSR